ISASTTAAPASAKALAVASPIPELAPVTSATWPSKPPFIELLPAGKGGNPPVVLSQFLPRRPEQDFVYVHIVRLLDREGDGAREGDGGDREILVILLHAGGRLRVGDVAGELRRDRARRDDCCADIVGLHLLPQPFRDRPHRMLGCRINGARRSYLVAGDRRDIDDMTGL